MKANGLAIAFLTNHDIDHKKTFILEGMGIADDPFYLVRFSFSLVVDLLFTLESVKLPDDVSIHTDIPFVHRGMENGDVLQTTLSMNFLNSIVLGSNACG